MVALIMKQGEKCNTRQMSWSKKGEGTATDSVGKQSRVCVMGVVDRKKTITHQEFGILTKVKTLPQ